MMPPAVTIEGVDYPIGLATVGHAEVIAPVAGLFMQPGEFGATEITHQAGDLIDAVAVVTGCSREIVARQPLVEFVRIAEETAAGWIRRNGEYMENEVAPAVEALQQRIDTVVQASESSLGSID